MIVIVTGTSSGIGRAVAERFVADGHTVIAVSRREVPVEGASWRRCDVTSPSEINVLFDNIVAEHGRVDVLVNNAGVQVEKNLADTTDDDYDHVMDTNVRGVFLMCRAALAPMRSQQQGVIINIGSTAATHADHGMAVYNASKAAVQALTRSIAIDHGRDGVRCVAVAPGWVLTALADAAFELESDPAAARAAADARHPVGRMGRPEDVANLVAWLASDQAAYATGATFTLDGGAMAQSPVTA